MERIEVRLRNDTPFCELSEAFPDLRIYRWCSSVIDYIEIFGRAEDLRDSSVKLSSIVQRIDSEVVHDTGEKNRRTAAISCRCTVDNSTIRVAESMNLLWEAPAIYEGGYEIIKLISFNPEDISSFFDRMSQRGEAYIEKKKTVLPESLRDVYTISLDDLLGNLSEKQVRYLRDAISMGLFSTPRKILVEDLAATHGITKSTMQEHINKARNKLIQSMEPYLTLFLHNEAGNHQP